MDIACIEVIVIFYTIFLFEYQVFPPHCLLFLVLPLTQVLCKPSG